MPYIIKGPVPTMAVGDCPWCEKKNTILHLMAAYIDGVLGGDYVCAKCMLALDEMREENAKDKVILKNNPKIEVEKE